MSLVIDNLQVNYGAIRALKGVTLHLETSEIVTIIGSNGAGKTTLCRTISGLIRPKGGQITYEGENLTRLEPHEIVEGGLVQVPEGRMIFQNLTVDENLELGAYVHKKNHSAFKETRDEVLFLFPRLKERLKQSAGTLSGGEQQMLAIGRALMSRPKCLLLDEPSLGLAPNLIHQIFESLKTIHRRGVSILLIEQDAFLALKTASRAYVLETGEISIEGACSDLMGNPEVKKAYLGIY